MRVLVIRRKMDGGGKEGGGPSKSIDLEFDLIWLFSLIERVLEKT